MASASWLVEALVRFSGNGPAFMGRLASSTQAANATLSRQLGLIGKNDAAMLAYRRRMAQVAAEQNAFITKASFGIAAVGAVAMGYAISQAANLQRAMTGVQIATASTADEYRKLQGMVFSVSGMTAQSAVTIANEMKVAATSGLNRPQDLMKAFPQIAMLADVMWLNKRVDPQSTVKYATQFAHFFGAYSGKPLANMLDDVARLQMLQPEGMDRMVQQGKYFIPFASRMGMDEHTIMRYMALMGQTGLLTGRGGTGMGQILYHALNTAAMTGHLSKAQDKGLSDLGLLNKNHQLDDKFLTKTGAIDVDKLMGALVADRVAFSRTRGQRGPSDWAADVKNAFGVQATQIIGIIASAVSQERMKVIDTQMTKIRGVLGQWEEYQKDFFMQWARFLTNLQNVATSTGLPTLPKLTTWLHDMSEQIGRFDDFLNAHPDVAAKIAVIGSAFTGLFALRAGIGALAMLTKAATAFAFVATSGEVAAGAAQVGLMAKALRGMDILLLGGLGSRFLALGGGMTALAGVPFGTIIAGLAGVTLGILALHQGAQAEADWVRKTANAMLRGKGKVLVQTGVSEDGVPIFEITDGGVRNDPAPRGTARKPAKSLRHDIDPLRLTSQKAAGRPPFGPTPKTSGKLLHDLDPMHLRSTPLLHAPAQHGGPHAMAPITIHVDARGSQDPHATEKAAERGAKRGLAAALDANHPRSMMATAPARTRSHPNIPRPLFTGFSIA